MDQQPLDEKIILLNQMREISQENEQSLRNSAHTYGYRQALRSVSQTDDYALEPPQTGTFSLRLTLSVLIFLGFLWTHTKGIPIWGYQSEQVVEAVSQNVDLRELADSVKIVP